jgi:hypothetical protein
MNVDSSLLLPSTSELACTNTSEPAADASSSQLANEALRGFWNSWTSPDSELRWKRIPNDSSGFPTASKWRSRTARQAQNRTSSSSCQINK